MSDDHDTYSPTFLTKLLTLWGEGFLSPGGAEAVTAIVDGCGISGKSVLDIGSGLGGPSFLLVQEHGAAHVTGIDVLDDLVDSANTTALRLGLEKSISFLLIDPGPLPFEDGSFDVVFSKDSIVQVADKAALVDEIKRVLKPGGQLAMSDWYGGKEPLSPEAKTWLKAADLTFALRPVEDFAELLSKAGFKNVRIEDRISWYANQSQIEKSALQDEVGRELESMIRKEETTDWLWRTTLRSTVVRQGHLRPENVWATKPNV